KAGAIGLALERFKRLFLTPTLKAELFGAVAFFASICFPARRVTRPGAFGRLRPAYFVWPQSSPAVKWFVPDSRWRFFIGRGCARTFQVMIDRPLRIEPPHIVGALWRR